MSGKTTIIWAVTKQYTVHKWLKSLVCTRTLCARTRRKLNRVVTLPLFTFRKHVISKPKFLLVQYTRYKHLYQTLRLPLLCSLADMLHRNLCGLLFCSRTRTMEWRIDLPNVSSKQEVEIKCLCRWTATRAKLSPFRKAWLCLCYVCIFIGRISRHPHERLAFLSRTRSYFIFTLLKELVKTKRMLHC
jgi:hypothetical protein